MIFLVKWILFYISIMFTMSVDNIFWIPTSPEYKQFKKAGWTMGGNYNLIANSEGVFYSKLDYIIRYRIWSVLTHPRDIIPAIVTSFILALIW